MALLLADAAELSNDVVLQGVIETIVKESPFLARLPFIAMVGNALTYNRENAVLAAQWHAAGGTWTEEAPVNDPVTATLAILGGDADVDQYMAQTRGNINDLEAVVIEAKAKGVAHEFENNMVYGAGASDELTGLHSMIGAGAQQVNMGTSATGAALSVGKVAEMIDLVRPGKPDFLVMSRRTRRGLSTYARALTSPVQYEPGEFGQRVMFFDGIPVLVDDFLSDVETIASGRYSAETGGLTSSIFAVKVGEGLLAGLTNGGIQVEAVGALEAQDAKRWRIKWYVGLALFSTLALARLDGITSAAVVA